MLVGSCRNDDFLRKLDNDLLMMQFTPEQKVLNDLFGNDITYIIPAYQRPYSWDCIGKSDKNNQVNIMWQDLIEFFSQEREYRRSKSPCRCSCVRSPWGCACSALW